MAVLKCKMCGGNLDVQEGRTVCECEYCGSKQTVPSVDDEKKITLFARANRLRYACEFDKASGVYESIISEYQEEAEAYWGLILCKYGIEYVDDPTTGKKVPTCHRSSFDSVMKDDDFEQVMELSDSISRKIYREEAKSIEELRKGIIEISGKEEPYDIFICYKEIDENGKRTIDSVIAQDVYDELVKKGYRVFFSRISLEDKLGQEYEPYIFAALNSAKLMLAFGTSYDYYNAVWVKNEWSRFLKLMAKGKGKYLIPCYKDLDAYDIPEEFSRFQAQDMGKVGATQDLLRGIEKLLGDKKDDKNSSDSEQSVIVNSNNPSVDSLLKRVEIFLGDSEWESANEYCERVLDIEPENATAYIGKLLAKYKMHNLDELSDYFKNIGSIKKADTLDAVDRNECEEILKDVIEKYELKEYFTDSTIHNRFSFNPSYKSFVTCRKKQKKEVLSEINNEVLLKRAKQYGSDELCNKIDKMISEIKQTLDERLKRAKEDDDKNKKKIKEKYDKYKDTLDETIINAINKAKEDVDSIDTERVREVCRKARNMFSISGPELCVVANTDGIVVFQGSIPPARSKTSTSTLETEYEVCLADFKNIVAIKALKKEATFSYINIPETLFLAGLTKDGRVKCTGKGISNEYEVSHWSGIKEIELLGNHLFGLRYNGTVVSTVDGEVEFDNDIVRICAIKGIVDNDKLVVLDSKGNVYKLGVNKRNRITKEVYPINGKVTDVFNGITDVCFLFDDGTCNRFKAEMYEPQKIVNVFYFKNMPIALLSNGRLLYDKTYKLSNREKKCLECIEDYNKECGILAINCFEHWNKEYLRIVTKKGNFEYLEISDCNGHRVVTSKVLQTESIFRNYDEFANSVIKKNNKGISAEEESELKRVRRAQWKCQYCGGDFINLIVIYKCKKCGRNKDY